MMIHPTKAMLETRRERLFCALNSQAQSFDTALILSRVNQYYFTGTMQDGILVLQKDGSCCLFVRKSFERARLESPLDEIYPMRSYGDMLSHLPKNLGSVYLEKEVIPMAMLERLQKYFAMEQVLSLDPILTDLRAVKSDYELEIMKESGRQHQRILGELVPSLLREGISEVEFAGQLYAGMIEEGYHGISRFSMFQLEMIIGQLGFGENSIYPTNFNGPGGMLGLHPAVPIIGSRERRLKKGDLVFVDIGYGFCGYHSDKTQVYSFGQPPSKQVQQVHNDCRQVLAKALAVMLPGNLPEVVYQAATDHLPTTLSRHFMGMGKDSVKFLGHGVGLYIDEGPVIALGQKKPLEENMVVALEPKCCLEGIGMVGVEETYIIKKDGPVCITGGDTEIFVV